MNRRATTATVALAVLALASAAEACSVPVFRYALERWPADPYRVVVYTEGEPSDEVKAVLEAVEAAATADPAYANIEAFVFDVTSDKSDPMKLRPLWEQHGGGRTPWMAVLYPARGAWNPLYAEVRSADMIWSGDPSVEFIDKLVDSPVRREIARRILKGESAVWVLLLSGDAEADAAARKMLGDRLKELGEQLQLPEIDPFDQRYVSPGGPELRIAFSTIELRRDDPHEVMLIRMMLHMEEGLVDVEGPVLVPFYGRGRMLGALAGEFLNPATIDEVAWFLTGSCSCEVKELNPGTDALIAGGWEVLLGGPSSAALDEMLPSLAAPTPAAASASPEAVAVRAAASGEPAEADAAGGLMRTVVIVIIAITVLIVLASAVLGAKASRDSA